MDMDGDAAVDGWELWAIANVLASSHAEGAESYANQQREQARAREDKDGEIIWTRIIAELAHVRAGEAIRVELGRPGPLAAGEASKAAP